MGGRGRDAARMAGANERDVTRLWRAEAMLRHDRRSALAELERCFVTGGAPEGLDGPLDGRLVTGTLGSGLDVLMEAMSRLWMPWRGKAFEAEAKQGRNRFAGGARAMFRLLWPGYRDLLEDGSGGFTAFRFDTGVGESVTAPGLSVLKIDYDHPASPWPIRLILDELVHIGDGQHLGQALVRWRGGFRRVAWFALERPS
jgi:hypothetical protein